MKKALYAAGLLLLIVSCGKETVESPAIKTIVGVVEKTEVKTIFDNYSVKWKEGDGIIALTSSGATSTSTSTSVSADGASASFLFDGVSLSTDFAYALYPPTCKPVLSVSENNLIYISGIPSQQTAVSGGFADEANLSIAEVSSDGNAEFKNVGALLGVKFESESKTVSSVKLTASGNRLAGSGWIYTDSTNGFASSGTDTEANGGSATVTLNDIGASSGTYWAVVYPRTYSGISVEFTLSDGTTKTYTSSSSFTLTRNGAYLLRDFDLDATSEDNVTRWDFSSQSDWASEWEYDSYSSNNSHVSFGDGYLYITTPAGSTERNKVRTKAKTFGTGTYTWRVYTPAVTAKDKFSTGAFIYCDDQHELDFEVGYGDNTGGSGYQYDRRTACGAADGQLVAALSSQYYPEHTYNVAIDPGWHSFTLVMDLQSNGNYKAEWLIDGVSVHSLNLNFGPSDATFYIMCSAEVLNFMGVNNPTIDYTATFDYVTYKPI